MKIKRCLDLYILKIWNVKPSMTRSIILNRTHLRSVDRTFDFMLLISNFFSNGPRSIPPYLVNFLVFSFHQTKKNCWGPLGKIGLLLLRFPLFYVLKQRRYVKISMMIEPPLNNQSTVFFYRTCGTCSRARVIDWCTWNCWWPGREEWFLGSLRFQVHRHVCMCVYYIYIRVENERGR